MTGIDRIRRAFEARVDMKIMAHAVCGYPSMEASARIFGEMVAAGADIVEAQLPFSDPSADGGSIVEANHAALRAGSRTEDCLALLESLRAGTAAPILVMSYLNPILAYGVDAMVERAARSGLDGFIVPDYPDDEPELGLAEKCAAAGLALVPLIAPTTSLERAAALAWAAKPLPLRRAPPRRDGKEDRAGFRLLRAPRGPEGENREIPGCGLRHPRG